MSVVEDRNTKGLGNLECYARFRSLGQYWDLVALAWVASESADTLHALAEYPDAGDSVESNYGADILYPPGGPFTIELIKITTGEVWAKGTTDASVLSLGSPMQAGTAVTVSPAQVLGGALQSLLPINATATIEAPQGDAYPIPWAIGSDAAKTDARFFFIAKIYETDADDAATNIIQEITIADAANVAGMNVLTTTMTATVRHYHAKVKRVDSDGTSNPLTVWKGTLNVVPNVG